MYQTSSPSAVNVSVLASAHNEGDLINAFIARVAAALDDAELAWKLIVVDDGSTDGTWENLRAAADNDSRIGAIRLSRRFGKDTALAAALDRASGDAIVLIDADLQDPPEVICDMVARWREGAQVIFAVRRARHGESLYRRTCAQLFYKLINLISDVELLPNAGDFCLIDRRAADALRDLRESNRYLKGLISWIGFERAAVTYDRDERSGGASNWNFWRLFNFAIDGITSFSRLPLQLAAWLGAAIALLAFVTGAALMIYTLTHGISVPGYASLMVTVLFLGGVQLICLGILGEYVGRLFMEVKGRPLYLVRETAGISETAGDGP